MPDIKLDEFRSSLIKAGDNVRGKAREIDIDPALEATMGKLAGFRAWFEKRLDDAIKAAEADEANAVKKVDGSGSSNGNGSGVYSSVSFMLGIAWVWVFFCGTLCVFVHFDIDKILGLCCFSTQTF